MAAASCSTVVTSRKSTWAGFVLRAELAAFYFFFLIFFFKESNFFFLAMLQGLWDLSHLSRN